MVLSWKQPTFLGGADITGYFVDYRQVVEGVVGKWHEANVKSVTDRAYRVRGPLGVFGMMSSLWPRIIQSFIVY